MFVGRMPSSTNTGNKLLSSHLKVAISKSLHKTSVKASEVASDFNQMFHAMLNLTGLNDERKKLYGYRCLVLMDVEEITQINFAAKFKQHRLTTDTEGDIATVNLTFYKFP